LLSGTNFISSLLTELSRVMKCGRDQYFATELLLPLSLSTSSPLCHVVSVERSDLLQKNHGSVQPGSQPSRFCTESPPNSLMIGCEGSHHSIFSAPLFDQKFLAQVSWTPFPPYESSIELGGSFFPSRSPEWAGSRFYFHSRHFFYCNLRSVDELTSQSFDDVSGW